MTSPNTVYIVHSIDTEGPLYESLQATFERLVDLYDIHLPTSYATLEKLRKKEIDLGGKEDVVAKTLDPTLLDYNDTWDKIESMLSKIMSKEFRNQLLDHDGNGWIYNWHCLDHVEFKTNPRRRDMGYHNIHDRYLEFIDKYDSPMDTIEWHFHPMSTYQEAHRCATSYENSPHLHQILCRRIIERNFFPSVFRAGFQTERPDSHWFLEQWIPFDASNMAVEDWQEIDQQNDFKNGRSGDWRRAPNDWSIYHPDFYDYQIPGQCRRYIARFLNTNTRIACINQYEVDRAFAKATDGENVLMGITGHDFRDMAWEVDHIREFIKSSSKKYPNARFKYARANDAFKAVVHEGKEEKLELKVDLYKDSGCLRLKVETLASEVFGPQPYLALKTRGGRFIHDNLDFGMDGKTWHYAFDHDTVPPNDLDIVGIAANNIYGNTFIKVTKHEGI